MSDLADQYDGVTFEPDEDTLVSALRNQDDIPILMDVVAEQVNIGVSQESHFARSFDDTEDHDDVESCDASLFSPALVSKVIADVLEKRLPELVAEVMEALNSAEPPIKKD